MASKKMPWADRLRLAREAGNIVNYSVKLLLTLGTQPSPHGTETDVWAALTAEEKELVKREIKPHRLRRTVDTADILPKHKNRFYNMIGFETDPVEFHLAIAEQEAKDRPVLERPSTTSGPTVAIDYMKIYTDYQALKAKRRYIPPGCQYNTLKQAKADGFVEDQPHYYGGEVLEMKNHRLRRNFQVAKSESAWRKRGRIVKPGESPICVRGFKPYRCPYVEYGVYSEEQTIEK